MTYRNPAATITRTSNGRRRGRALVASRRAMLLGGTAVLCLSAPALADEPLTVTDGATYQIVAGSPIATGIPVQVGPGSSGTLTIQNGGELTLDTTNEIDGSGIEIGNGGVGTVNIDGGTLTVNVVGTANTSAGAIWVGSGATGTSGTGTLNMTDGLIQFLPAAPGTVNYGAIAIGRGPDLTSAPATNQITGTFNQSGGRVIFETGGSIDIGTQGGNGTYNLSGDASMSAPNGGLTIYVGSRTDSSGRQSTGAINVHDDAQIQFVRSDASPIHGGQIYVGDAGSTGSITQDGAGSVVTLGLQNPIRFGGNVSNSANGGGNGSYMLSAGTLDVQNTGGGAQIIFGDSAGGVGTFTIQGGSATIATSLILGNSGASGGFAAAQGLISQTGGTLTIAPTGNFYLSGSGNGTYNLEGGMLRIGGAALKPFYSNAQNITPGNYAFNIGNGTIQVTGTALNTTVNATLLDGTTATIDTNGLGATWTGILSGTGGLRAIGGATLTLGGVDSYSGGTTIDAGTTLKLTNTGQLTGGGALANDGIFDISAATSPVGVGALSGSGTIENGLNTLVVGLDNQDSSFSGTVHNQGVSWTDPFGVLVKAGTGTLTLNGATVTGGEFHVTDGALAVTDGTTAIDYLTLGIGTGATGTLNISGGSLTAGVGLQVGDFSGNGTVNQTGGLVTVEALCGLPEHCASINIGNQGGTGVYNLSGGELAFSGGMFILGRNSATNPASNGTLNISGDATASIVNGEFIIGDSLVVNGNPAGTGLVTQTGGILSIDSTSTLYLSGSGSGRYDLLGGTLQIGGDSLHAVYGSNPATHYAFNLGDGTIQVTGSALTAAANATLLDGTTATIDTNGLGATWTGILSGTGGLRATGGATLTLSGVDSYSGGTTIDAGTTLKLTNTGQLTGGGALADDGDLDLSAAVSPARFGALSGSGTIENGLATLTIGLDNQDSSFSGTIHNQGVNWTDPFGVLEKTGTGTLTLNDATITGGEFHVTGGGLEVTDGATRVDYLALGTGVSDGVPANATLNISGGTLTAGVAIQVGDFGGNGTVNQTGGLVSIESLCGTVAHCASLNIGNQGGTGLYNLSGGQLTLNDGLVILGRNSATNPASNGTLNISGDATASIINAKLIIGDNLAVNGNPAGTGLVTQMGGTLSIDSTSGLYLSGTGRGRYDLLGGTLQIGGDSLHAVYGSNPTTNYIFNIGNGTIQVTGSALNTAVNATLLDETTATIDTNGLGASWTGVLSGTGGLRATGAGALTLTAANSYSGDTTVEAGSILRLTGAGSIANSRAVVDGGFDVSGVTGGTVSLVSLAGGSDGLVTLGGKALTLTNAQGDFGGVIDGTGSLNIAGGTQIFSGDSSFVGVTTIANGATLQLGNGGVGGGFVGDVTNNGTLVINRSDDIDVTNNLTGSGSFVKTGAGTVTLTHDNSYTGDTVVNGGTLALVSDHGAGTGMITLNDGSRLSLIDGLNVANALGIYGTVTFDVADGDAFESGALSGDGTYVFSGGGVLHLTGDNSNFTGTAAIVDGGTVDLAGDGTLGGASVVVQGTGATFNYGNEVEIANAATVEQGAELTALVGDGISAVQAGSVTGDGKLTKTGDGTLVLTGDNSLGGGVTIAGGTLQVGNNGSTGSLQGDVANDGTLVFNRSDDDASFSGAISGSGTVVQMGSGTLVLTGDNSYEGGTVLGAGTLVAGSSGALGVGGVDMAEGTTLGYGGNVVLTNAIFISGDPTLDVADGLVSEQAGVIADGGTPGDIVKTGGGTLILSADNTYTGGTTVSAGTLQLGNGGTTGSILAGDHLEVDAGATLAFNHSDDVVFDAVVSGAGSLDQMGPGKLTVTSAQTYTGGTTVSGGTLSVSADSNLGDLAGGLTLDGGTLENSAVFTTARTISLGAGGGTFLNDADLTVAGAITGVGDFSKSGSGTMTLIGTETYTGRTIVSGGELYLTAQNQIVSSSGVDLQASGATLSLGALVPATFQPSNQTIGSLQGVAGSVVRFVTGSSSALSTLTINQNIDTVYAGALSGPGQLTKLGTGKLTLTGEDSFNGVTNIDGGELEIAGGGSIDNSSTLLIGSTEGSSGTLTVSGVGSQVTASNFRVGATGDGQLNILDGGHVTSVGTVIAANVNGAALVSGAGSVWEVDEASSNGFLIGSGGSGSLTVADSGVVSVYAGEGASSGLGTINLAQLPGSTGVINIGAAAGEAAAAAGTIEAASIKFGGLDGVGTGSIVFNHTSADYEFAPTISGAGSVEAYAGTTVLTAANTYSGETNIYGGTLALAGLGSIASSSGVRVDGNFDISAVTATGASITSLSGRGTVALGEKTLTLTQASSTFSGSISGIGGLSVQAGREILTGDSDYTGGTAIASGATLQIGATAAPTFNIAAAPPPTSGMTGSILGDVANDGVLSFQRSNDITFGGVISGSGSVDKYGAGKLILAVDNSYTGGTTVRQGTLSLLTNQGAGTGTITLSNGTTLAFADGLNVANDLVISGLVSFNVATGEATESGALSGDGTYALTGDGTLHLTGDNSGVSGTVVLSGLTIDLANSTALGSSTVQVSDDGATLHYGDGIQIANEATVDDGAMLTADVDAGTSATQAGAISGLGSLTKTSGGTLILTAANTFSGGTTISGGTLEIADGGSLQGDIANDGVLAFDRSDDGARFDGVISGSGSVQQNGTGTLMLTGDNSYTGGTALNAGTLVAGSDGALGLGGVDMAEGTTLGYGGSFVLTNAITVSGDPTLDVAEGIIAEQAGVIADGETPGDIVKTGDGTLILSATNSYSGGTTVSAGTLQIGNGATGSIAGDVVDSATLAFNRSADIGFDGVISGNGVLQQIGTGMLTLTGDSSAFAGTTTVTRGGLSVGGSLGGAVAVATGGTLTGSGILSGPVTVSNGGTLAGTSGQTLQTGSLTLGTGSIVSASLGAPSDSTLFDVHGDLALNGTLNVTDLGGFGPGVYRLFDYSGVLSGAGLTVGTTPSGVPADSLAVQTAVTGQVNLASSAGATLTYWDGGAAGNANNGAVDGGDGVWSPTAANWTTIDGVVNAANQPQPSFAIFQATPGVVTVSGAVVTGGMQFAVDGYSIVGDPLALDGQAIIRVGDNSDASPAMTATIESALTGTGGLVKTDRGTLVLTGTNDYAGGTTITGGVLQLGNGGTTGAIVGDIENNATLVFDRSDSSTFNGVIFGTGAVTQIGSGTTTLTAANSYAGATTITNGTLALTGAGDIAASSGVADNGVFDISGADGDRTITTLSGSGSVVLGAQTLTLSNAADSFGGTISGEGGFALAGGAETLAGVNSYTGGTTISAGTLTGTAASFGSGAIVDNGTLVVDQADDADFANTLSGSGAFTKQGQGTLTVTSDSSAFAGNTEIAQGTLAISGSLGGTLAIDSGAMLAGAGTVGSTSIASGGILSPAGSGTIGTLNINGNLSLAQGSTYAVDVDAAGHSDLVHVTGATTIGGGAVASIGATGNWLRSTRYTILTSNGGVTGTFGGATSNLAFLSPTLSYDLDNVYLTLDRNNVSYVSVAATRNQRATAVSLDGLTSGPVADAVVQLDAAGARRAFDALSGEVHADAMTLLQSQSGLLRATMLNHAFVPVAGEGVSGGANGLWMQGVGSWSQFDSNDNAASVTSSTGGLLGGIDRMIGDQVRVGIAGGWSRTDFSVVDRASKGKSQNYHLAAYAGARFGPIGVRVGGAYSWNDLSTTRNVAIGALSNALHADYDARTRQAFGELGYSLTAMQATIEPYAGVAYVDVSSDSFNENGGAAALHGDHASKGVVYSSLGARITLPFSLGSLQPSFHGKAEWQHAFGDQSPLRVFDLIQGDGATPFTIAGTPIAKNAALVEAGFDANLARNISVGVSYAGQIADHAQDNQVRGSLSIRF